MQRWFYPLLPAFLKYSNATYRLWREFVVQRRLTAPGNSFVTPRLIPCSHAVTIGRPAVVMVQTTVKTSGLINLLQDCGNRGEDEETSHAHSVYRGGWRDCSGTVAGYRTACCCRRSNLLFNFRRLSRQATLLCAKFRYAGLLHGQCAAMCWRKLLRESAGGLTAVTKTAVVLSALIFVEADRVFVAPSQCVSKLAD